LKPKTTISKIFDKNILEKVKEAWFSNLLGRFGSEKTCLKFFLRKRFGSEKTSFQIF
jgi:hypothetical protein